VEGVQRKRYREIREITHGIGIRSRESIKGIPGRGVSGNGKHTHTKEGGDRSMSNVFVRGVNDTLWQDFKDTVQQRYGKLHTVLGQEVAKALEAYLYQNTLHQGEEKGMHDKQEPKQEPENRTAHPRIMVGKTREERIKNIGKMLAFGSDEITDIGLRRFIATQGVGDDRVIDSYIQTMKLKGWLVTKERDAGLGVFRSTISKALDIQLPEETLDKMMNNYEMPRQAGGNGGRL